MASKTRGAYLAGPTIAEILAEIQIGGVKMRLVGVVMKVDVLVWT